MCAISSMPGALLFPNVYYVEYGKGSFSVQLPTEPVESDNVFENCCITTSDIYKLSQENAVTCEIHKN